MHPFSGQNEPFFRAKLTFVYTRAQSVFLNGRKSGLMTTSCSGEPSARREIFKIGSRNRSSKLKQHMAVFKHLDSVDNEAGDLRIIHAEV